VAAGLTVLLSGLSIVGAVLDGITGFYVTAAGRAFEVALMSAGLLAGVALVLQTGVGLGVDLLPPLFPPPSLDGIPVQVPAAAIAAAFFALASYAPPRALVGAALAGAGSWTTYATCFVIGMGPLGASAMPRC
jgi:hypothetical protein